MMKGSPIHRLQAMRTSRAPKPNRCANQRKGAIGDTCLICGCSLDMIDRYAERIVHYKDGEAHSYCLQMEIGIVPECPISDNITPKPCTNKCVQAKPCENSPECGCVCNNIYCQIGEAVRSLRTEGAISWRSEAHEARSPDEVQLRSDEGQLIHQKWREPDRLSIDLDCPPGDPMPPEVFRMVIADTGLTSDDFENSGSRMWGRREYLVKAEPEAVSRYKKARPTIEERLKALYQRGIVRAASW